jgi:hypothetical protein
MLAAAGLEPANWLHGMAMDSMDLKRVTIVLPKSPSPRESVAATLLIEEVRSHSGLDWVVGERADRGTVMLYLGARDSWATLPARVSSISSKAAHLPTESFQIATGADGEGQWIAVCGSDERGLIFGAGKLLRLMTFGRQLAQARSQQLNLSSSPRYPLRGHQLGYRPKTNAYDAWSVEIWDQYIRELAIFGTNAIEILPPISDDLADSPHFPLPPEEMMVEMSRIADKYGLDVWIWYPAMDPDYSKPETVEASLKQWGDVYRLLPRLDAVFVPGGDPGHTQPKYLLALLERQKQVLLRSHPKAQMWVSPQSFNAQWMDEFFTMARDPKTQSWLDGVVFGPQSRVTLSEMRQALPKKYPIRFYPDITHSVQAQYSVPDWDIAYALTEGREVINPRPEFYASILRESLPLTIGFISYSEGCNDDVNKFVWSLLAWDPEQSVAAALRDFGHYIIGAKDGSAYANGLLDLESNWHGPLASNELVDVTLARFQSIERSASPAVLQNWRWQQAMYRACCDAYVRQRLLEETGDLARARNVLARVYDIGWESVPWGIGAPNAPEPANGIDPQMLLDEAARILRGMQMQPQAVELRIRIAELAAALFQSIRMQLAVDRYQGEAVDRGANLDTMDHPVTEAPWLLRQIQTIGAISGGSEKVKAIKALLDRTNPRPGGYYDGLGRIGNRPHLVLSKDADSATDNHHATYIGSGYPDVLGASAPMAWKHWAETLYERPLTMHYTGLDPELEYELQVVYSGDARRIKIKLVANNTVEIHPLIERAWPPQPQKFPVPQAATRGTELTLAWTREPGLGGNGRGCQVAEVWLMPVQKEVLT